MTVKIREFKPASKNTLRGFVAVELPSGMIIRDITIHARDGKAWASPPGKPILDREGRHMRDHNGRSRYTPVVEFTSRERRDFFSALVMDALRAQHPDALDGEGAP